MFIKTLTNAKSNLSHLYIYSYRVYSLNKHISHTQKLKLRAYIRYFINYNLLNIYRI